VTRSPERRVEADECDGDDDGPNNCGQAIQLTYAGGISGATDDLGPGQVTNTGWSKAELAQKGVFNLYVCPAGYIPVDATTDKSINRAQQAFTCKER